MTYTYKQLSAEDVPMLKQLLRVFAEAFEDMDAYQSAILLMNIPAMAQSAPKILLIARETLKPGAEAEYGPIESETAVLAAKLGCPHPYLALQPLSRCAE
jgi:hypothetical protein